MSELVSSGSGLPDEARAEGSPDLASEVTAPAAVGRRTDGQAVTPKTGKLASERVIINAPMSFAGAAQRSFRLRGNTTGIARVGATVGVLLLMLVWWVAVAVWYLTFGLLLVPYRLLRRGARKRKAEALRHRELLSVIDRQDT